MQKYKVSFRTELRASIRAQQEITAAYVYSLTFKRFNPFAEVGVGALIFTPVLDNGTQTAGYQAAPRHRRACSAAGVAYELSPSFDHPGGVSRVCDQDARALGVADFKTNRYEVISMPTFGVAYHF